MEVGDGLVVGGVVLMWSEIGGDGRQHWVGRESDGVPGLGVGGGEMWQEGRMISA